MSDEPNSTTDNSDAAPMDRFAHNAVRVHDCLYNYCPARNPECAKCDAVKEALHRKHG